MHSTIKWCIHICWSFCNNGWRTKKTSCSSSILHQLTTLLQTGRRTQLSSDACTSLDNASTVILRQHYRFSCELSPLALYCSDFLHSYTQMCISRSSVFSLHPAHIHNACLHTVLSTSYIGACPPICIAGLLVIILPMRDDYHRHWQHACDTPPPFPSPFLASALLVTPSSCLRSLSSLLSLK